METKVTRVRTDLLEKIAEKEMNVNEYLEQTLAGGVVSEGVSATTEKPIPVNPKCPKCGEISSKDGRVTHRDGIHQRWICRTGCGYKFLEGMIRVFPKTEQKP